MGKLCDYIGYRTGSVITVQVISRSDLINLFSNDQCLRLLNFNYRNF